MKTDDVLVVGQGLHTPLALSRRQVNLEQISVRRAQEPEATNLGDPVLIVALLDLDSPNALLHADGARDALLALRGRHIEAVEVLTDEAQTERVESLLSHVDGVDHLAQFDWLGQVPQLVPVCGLRRPLFAREVHVSNDRQAAHVPQ